MIGEDGISRRALLKTAAAAWTASDVRGKPRAEVPKVSVFSKHLHFLEGEALAMAAAELGFDAIDLTVRKGGHVEPGRVAQDLPRLAAAIRRNHLEVSMVTTDIVDAQSPFTEDILRTMRVLGIRYYRWGGFRYDYAQPMAAQLEAFKPRVARLAEWNHRYGVTAIYHTHSGAGLVGASIWDLHTILKDFDPEAVAVNYDIAHATIEGGLGGWINSFAIIQPQLRGIAVKDFIWRKNAGGRWQAEFVPLGSGMVKLAEFFRIARDSGFAGPLQLHFEYPLGGAENGAHQLTMEQARVFEAMKRDLAVLRSSMGQAWR